MKTYFIRHAFERSTLEVLTKPSFSVGVIYREDSPSTNPQDYVGRGRSTIKRMSELAGADCLICATYARILPERMVVGKPKAGESLHLLEGTGTGNIPPVKGFALDQVKILPFEKHPVLATLMPRQGTLGESWPLSRIVPSLYSEQPLPYEVGSLSASQLEVVCFEYLRWQGKMDFLHLPIGRTLRSVDIVGSLGSQLVCAQVTFAWNKREVAQKIDALMNFAGEASTKYFFCPRSSIQPRPSIQFIAIEDAFDALKRSEKAAQGLKMLLYGANKHNAV